MLNKKHNFKSGKIKIKKGLKKKNRKTRPPPKKILEKIAILLSSDDASCKTESPLSLSQGGKVHQALLAFPLGGKFVQSFPPQGVLLKVVALSC